MRVIAEPVQPPVQEGATVIAGPGTMRDHQRVIRLARTGQHFEQDAEGRITVQDDKVRPILIGSVWRPKKGVESPALRVIGTQMYESRPEVHEIKLIVEAADEFVPLLDEYGEPALNVPLDLATLREDFDRVGDVSTDALDEVAARLEQIG